MKDFYTPAQVMADRFLTVEQVANHLQVVKMTVYRYIKAGLLPSYKIGKEYRIKESDLNSFLDQRKS